MDPEVVDSERLHEVRKRAPSERRLRDVEVVGSRDHRRRSIRPSLLDFVEESQSGFALECNIDEYEIEGLGIEELHGGCDVVRDLTRRHALEDPARDAAQVVVVVDDEDSQLSHALGSTTTRAELIAARNVEKSCVFVNGLRKSVIVFGIDASSSLREYPDI